MPRNLLSRLYKKKATVLTSDGSSYTRPSVTPEPRSFQSEDALPRASLSPPFERRIHPDLNALAAELSSDLQDTRHFNEISPLPQHNPTQIDAETPSVSLTPWIRKRHNSPSAAPTTTQIMNTETRFQETEDLPEPLSISTIPQSNDSPKPSNEGPESRANRIFNRLTGLGARASPNSNPPSAWNTFGRRRSSKHHSIPHASDFGASPDVSLSDSQRSHASSNQTSPWCATETSADTSGSLSMSLQSISHSLSRSQSQSQSFCTPTHIQHSHSPPSSAFTFGSVGPIPGQTPPALPTYPALRLSLFGGQGGTVLVGLNVHDEEKKHRDTRFDLNPEPLSQPRTSTSMPSLLHHRYSGSVSRDSTMPVAGPTRPRAQDIFPASCSLDQLKGARRRKRNRSSGAGSSQNSRRRRNIRRNVPGFLYKSELEAEVAGPSETCAGNIEMSEDLGTPFLLQQEPALGPSALDETPKFSAKHNKFTPLTNNSLHSPTNSWNTGKGKEKEKEKSSRTSPLRNVTPPTALAEFSVPPLSNPRPLTPLRSGMASIPKNKAQSPAHPIPLAASTSTSSLGKGKRKVDEVDGGGEDAFGGSVMPTETKPQQRRSVHRATFAAEPRTHRISASSHTTSYHARRKRARLTSGTSFATNQTVSEHGVRATSRTGSYRNRAPYAASSVSRGSHTPTQSLRAGSASSNQQHSMRYAGQTQRAKHPSSTRGSSKRGSVSQVSIPISALISPHAPSISLHPSTTYHMRDPRKPAPVHPTSWTLSFPSAGSHERNWLAGCFDIITCSTLGECIKRRVRIQTKEEEMDPEKQAYDRGEKSLEKSPVVDWIEGGGSPIQAWLFFLGFVLFPVWWIASLLIGIPKTRMLGGGGGMEEKSVVLDDPQVEHDAKSWRTRCRVMAAISLVTYVPFIVLVVVFVPRSER